MPAVDERPRPRPACGPNAVAVSTPRHKQAADPQEVVERSPHTVDLLGGAVDQNLDLHVTRARIRRHEESHHAVFGGTAAEDVHAVTVRGHGALQVAVVDRVYGLRHPRVPAAGRAVHHQSRGSRQLVEVPAFFQVIGQRAEAVRMAAHGRPGGARNQQSRP